jgi:hypothetical protein
MIGIRMDNFFFHVHKQYSKPSSSAGDTSLKSGNFGEFTLDKFNIV